jgi:DNA replication and repair protein RecF
MFLKKIILVNFKNYEQAEIDFSPGINAFVGSNAAGKTNLLDAIYYLSLTKSYLNTVDSQNIRYNQDFFVIQGELHRDQKVEMIYCGVKRSSRKIFKLDDKEYQKLSEHIGLIPAVIISPYDSSMIHDGSEERRRFINSVISQYDRVYFQNLMSYNRVLEQRNRLLKDFAQRNTFDPTSLEAWDVQLVALGEKIFEKRKEFLSDLMPIFCDYYRNISSSTEEIALVYISQLDGQDFQKALEESIPKDRILQYTSVGIHRDDIDFILDKHPVKKVGSQGQQKTLMVSLKLAEYNFIKYLKGYAPLLLLDDIFDKLDATRVSQLIKLVSSDNFGQIFITDTDGDRIRKILSSIHSEHKLFTIDNAKILDHEKE